MCGIIRYTGEFYIALFCFLRSTQCLYRYRNRITCQIIVGFRDSCINLIACSRLQILLFTVYFIDIGDRGSFLRQFPFIILCLFRISIFLTGYGLVFQILIMTFGHFRLGQCDAEGFHQFLSKRSLCDLCGDIKWFNRIFFI